MRRLLAIVVSLALSCVGGPVAADLPVEPRFESVGQASAIPSGVVAALAQDKFGFFWIGTGAGLVRYDGYSFRVQLRTEGEKAGKGLGFVRALFPAEDGRLWIGTESDGLAVYDPATERVQVFRSEADKSDSLAPGTIRALAEDRQGGIWVGTIGGGLDRFDPASSRFEHHRAGAGGLPDDRVQALLVDRGGSLWVGSWKGLSVRRPGKQGFENVLSAPGEPLHDRIVYALHQAEDGRLWIGTQQGQLLVLDPATGQAQQLDREGERGTVASFVRASDSELWVGRTGGIEVRGNDGRLLRVLRHSPRNPASLAGNEVRALLRDRSGWLWVGGYGGGLQRHDPGNRSIWVQREAEGHGGVFDDPNVRSVAQLSDGETWVGTTEKGVAIFDREMRLARSLLPAPGRAGGLPNGRVGAIAQTSDGVVWLGSDAGVHQLNAARTQVVMTLKPGQGRVRRMFAGSDGRLWIATQDGLYLYERGATQLKRLSMAGGRMLSGDVNALTEAADGGLWVGTENGLFRVAPGGVELLPVQARAGQELSHVSVVGLLVDRQQRLWVDTAIGLHKMLEWDGRLAAFDRISEHHGIGGRAFGANLMQDNRGRIWTQHHIYDPLKDQVYELTGADGVDIGTGWFRAYSATRDGRMLFGGSRGLLVVNPDLFDGWNFQPPVVLAELRVDGRRQGLGQAASGLSLKPGQRSFSAEFAALDYSDPARCRYRYKLEGYDNDWVNTGADFRVASYSNLSPGQYLLKVRATNRSGAWSPQELMLQVEVLPNWWQTWWANAVFAVLALLALLGVIQLRTGYLRRRQQVLQDMVRNRTAELETLSATLQVKSAALEESSLTDPLTGLRNRRFLTQHIESDVSLTLRRYEDVAHGHSPPQDGDLIFFLVDIDHFKSVNDEYGHAGGDAVLVQMRERLQPVFREADYLVRWGGEEFLIVARAASREHAMELAERARAMVSDTPFKLPGGALISRSCSVGFAVFPLSKSRPRAVDWAGVVTLADGALYAAKRAGRNRWVGVLGIDEALQVAEMQRRARASASDWLEDPAIKVVRSQPQA
ncbi:ligand-binding sensor domain-containing diguanylate cyclase [Pelomonas sp. SE-A7]|uniref:ligand-binding sensor domain-containing diguanylate cyclase n=1 Tax=Pelomonas sp. SE-A7 TaxID=3054953 RepID=UPI00259CD5ED|nr:ligand-binding sensor domain-containing diguanylate cyclase [Pelomonas sp. SE-A7]MDM4766901.1 two-component regulator propeller domain-containing protein [Pelomonas sp. SE-A7]